MTKVSQADVIRLGPQVAAVKRRLKPRDWRSIVQTAHSRGFTVAGQLSGAPDPLKERTQRSLREQATKTINTAYQPVEQELSRRQARINAVAEKRRVDNETYARWLKDQTDTLHAQARAADQGILDRQKQIAAQSAAAWVTAQAEAAQRSAATAGTVSDTKQSTALDMKDEAANTSERVAAQRELTSQMVGTGEKAMQMAAAAVLARQAATEGKRQGDQQAGLSEVEGDRKKLALDKAADAAKEIARLLDGETSKANANRDFDAVAEKLGLARQNMELDALKQARDYKLDKKKIDLETWKARNKDKWEAAKLDLGYDKIAEQNGRAAADRELRKWIARNKPAAADKPRPKHVTDKYEMIETARGEIVDLHKRFPKGTTKQGRTFRQVLRERGYTDPIIDLAEDLRRNGGKLSGRGRAKANALGIDPRIFG